MKRKTTVRRHKRKGKKVRKHTRRCIKYGTIKRGKVKFKRGSKQERFLRGRGLSFSTVEICDGVKRIKRVNPRKKIARKGVSFFRETAEPGEPTIFDFPSDEELREVAFQEELREREFRKEAELQFPGFADTEEIEELAFEAIKFKEEDE